MTGSPEISPTRAVDPPPTAQQNQASSHPPAWTWLLFAAVASYYLYRTVILPLPAIGPQISDFWWYHEAARAVISGSSPFSVEDFVYPPLFAFLVLPLGLAGYEIARWLWFGLSHLFLVGAGALLWRILGADRLALLVVVSVWALGGAIAESLMLGQINPLLLVLVVASWYPSTGTAGPASLGLAAAIKIWPATLFASYALARKWKPLMTGLAATGTLFLFPWLAIRLFLAGPHWPAATRYWMGTPALFNFSLPAVALRLLDPPGAGDPLPHNWVFGNNIHELRVAPADLLVSVAVAAATLLLGFAALYAATRGNLAPRRIPLASAALVSLSLAASPVCWSHYHLLQYPGAALLLATFLRERRFGIAVLLAALFLGTYQVPIAGLGPYLAHFGWTAGNAPLLWLLSSMAPLCSLALFALYVGQLRRGASDGVRRPVVEAS